MAAKKALIAKFEYQGLITLKGKAEFVQFLRVWGLKGKGFTVMIQ